MLYKALLLLLPAVAYAQITVDVIAGAIGEESHVHPNGNYADSISDTERETWQITDEQLLDVVETCHEVKPDIVFIRGPTPPWRDQYILMSIQEVRRHVRPHKWRILGVNYESVILATQKLANNSTATVTYNACLRQPVEESVSTTWRTGGELTVSQEIRYSFVHRTTDGTTELLFNGSWGKDKTISKTVTVGSESGVPVKLKPGEAVVATLIASKASMAVELNYTAYLDGILTSRHTVPAGSYFLFQHVADCLTDARKRNTIISTELIKFGFYTDVKLVLLYTRPEDIP